MRMPLVAGNWKMNGSRKSAATLFDAVVQGADSLSGVEIAVFPPFPLLADGARLGQPGRGRRPEPGRA